MVPGHFSGAVVERAQGGISPNVTVAPAPSLRFSRSRAVVHAEVSAGIDIEETRLRIKTRRHPICAAVGTWMAPRDRKSTRLNSSHLVISYAVFCLKKKKNE